MIKNKLNFSPSEEVNKNFNILEQISPEKALEILNILAQEDEKIAAKIEQIFQESLTDTDIDIDIDIDEIAQSVCWNLELLEVQEVWDNAGSTRYGYVDPNELAWEMFDEAIQPFLEQCQQYQNMSMPQEAKYYCMGILKGLYLFEIESKSEFKHWSMDAGHDNFTPLLDDCKKTCNNSEELKEMDEFIQENCPRWYRKI